MMVYAPPLGPAEREALERDMNRGHVSRRTRRAARGSEGHAENARMHAIGRAQQRFRVTLGLGDIAALEAEIREGRAPSLGQAGDSTLHRVRLGQQYAIAVFHVGLQAIKSFLDPNASFGENRPFDKSSGGRP